METGLGSCLRMSLTTENQSRRILCKRAYDVFVLLIYFVAEAVKLLTHSKEATSIMLYFKYSSVKLLNSDSPFLLYFYVVNIY